MRDPARIDEMLDFLRGYWKANPDLRLGQIVRNGAMRSGWRDPDPFNIEDKRLLDGMKEVARTRSE